ncbi:hypothetical protein BGW39_009430 [Mortierella sp. 14UC]|nr:hypothetical protein BGW39_009430 [Mortierella sp. 14UC]
MQFPTIISLAIVAILSIVTVTVSSAPIEPCKDNERPKCNRACTKEYAPWCAKLSSGEFKEFGNKCMLQFHKCKHPKDVKKATKGACPKPTPICAMACIEIYDPVCATFQDGSTKTYGNQCLLRNAMCGRPKKTYTTTKGECPKSKL